MRIKNIRLKNLRLYGNEEQTTNLDDDKNIAILLGDNGAGKTSLLYGCSVLLSQFTGAFPGTQKKMFSQEDIRNVSNEAKADFLHVGITLGQSSADETEYMPIVPEVGESISIDMYLKGNNPQDTPDSVLKEIKDYSSVIKSKIDNAEQVALPILAYYGTERGQIKPVERRRNFTDIFPRWDIYMSDALASATDFKRFFTWFERNEDIERRQQIELKDFGYKSYVLEAVRRALELLFPHLKNPRVLTSPLRFVMDDVSEENNPLEQRIERMSDGYRITVALVADIAARMAEANPSEFCSGLNDPLNASGIILIDEIDLHLHPKLQREILRKLNTIFPNVQFIVSTHSPSVVLGALDIAQVIKLENGVINDVSEGSYSNYDVSLLLLSNLFNLDNVRTDLYKSLEEEYEGLLMKSSLNDEERERFNHLSMTLNQFSSDDLVLLNQSIQKATGHDSN